MSKVNIANQEPVEVRIDQLLGQMTLEEKIGQMNQAHQFREAERDAIRQGEVGSILNAAGPLTGLGASPSAKAEVCNECQRLAVTESRLGIPILFGRDVIHGYRTVFPIPLAQAASWNPDLVEQAASVAAREATADGIKWTFAPMVDIARDPRWGRIAEGNGEDPYLGSTLAAASVRGFQGENLADPRRLVACAKHYAGYGAAEGGRDYETAELSVPTLRDVYLPPFRAAVEAGVGTLMAGFQDLAGMPMSCNRWLLTEILRGEWGFRGFVVSDWASVVELVQHGVAEDDAHAAVLAAHAGVDMEMVSGTYLRGIGKGVKAGALPESEIDEAVRRILRVKILAGLFEQPYTDTMRAGAEILAPEHRTLARRAAEECMVLLKNEGGILPLDGRFRRVLVCGPLVHAQGELFGTWAPDGREEEAQSLPEAIRENAPQENQIYFAATADEAVRYAATADVVVFVAGEHPSRSGENSNVSTLDLPPGQREFLETIAGQGKPVALVVLAGRPLAIGREARLAGAVLYAWHPGIEGGAALADLLFGRANPSGRLPVTVPRSVGQVPIYYGHKNSGRPAGQGGFPVRYVDLPHGPLYPFGFGLSYTRFAYLNLEIEKPDFHSGENRIRVEVANSGARAGMEVVQIYVRDLVGSVTRPVKELKGFQKIHLEPGEMRRVEFTLSPEDLAFTGLDGKAAIEPGEFQVWVGPNSAEGLKGAFRLIV
jgi:beta-glucosidase